ncbi:MAG: OmpA family protein [Spirochaetales bacterium]|jgi:outer membrane protein OmpA-like peptidoglycan-associated protein|nr:OmpA family protein [Spirochaetales bacterium]
MPTTFLTPGKGNLSLTLGLLFGAALFFPLPSLAAQEGALPWGFQPGEELSYTERLNLRVRLNGRYQGLLSREVRGGFRREDSGPAYWGSLYILEQLVREAVPVYGREVGGAVLSRLLAAENGALWAEGGSYPSLRGVPALPEELPGLHEVWQSRGEWILLGGEFDPPARIGVVYEYRYLGFLGEGAEGYHRISCRFSLRYPPIRAGETEDNPPLPPIPNLLQASGSHEMEIRLYPEVPGKLFIRDVLEEEYGLAGGQRTSYGGFILTWWEPPAGKESERRARLEQELGPEEGITLNQGPQGLVLTLPDLHFAPDQAALLPGEEERLSTLAEILEGLPGLFLVRGHTADVGSAESQEGLSVLRAREIVSQLTRRGLSGERFLYEGAGGREPLGDNATEEGRRQNRRVEIILIP